MKKIGLYLSVGPQSGGSFQYCLSVLKYLQSLNSKLYKLTQEIDFAELCITSKSSVKENNKDEVIVETKKAKGNKCPICWKIKMEACERHSCPV